MKPAINCSIAGLPVSPASSDNRNWRSIPESSRRSHARARGFVSFVAVFILISAFCAAAKAQVTLATNWTELSPASSPSARFDQAMAYDAAHSQVVLFGGGGGLSDTWLWNGTNWSKAGPATIPTGRGNQAMAYDAATGQVVMFGGIDSSSARLGDTWLWDGTNWTAASPVVSPPARDGAAMVYDAATGNIVLFGGVNAGGTPLSDTWLWNGTNWSFASPATNPPARFDQAMAYDAAHSQVVMFGGTNGVSYFSDTWLWNGSNWILETPATIPGGRYGEGMDYDAALGQTVMFGGYNGSAYLNDTWMWDGNNWNGQSPATNPSPRYTTNAMVYDAAQNGVVMFGGGNCCSEFGDTWVWGFPQNFGNINVCPSGQSTEQPCSNTLPLTYNVATTSAIGPNLVVTQGSSGLDFASSSDSCTGTVSPGTCTVTVAFTPQASGLRLGAVQLVDPTTGRVLVTTPIYGNGQSPVATFSPLTTFVESTGPYTLSGPKGVAVDVAGDIFMADTGNGRVVEAKEGGANGFQTVGTGLVSPQALAVDGAGDLFIADPGLNSPNGEVLEVPAGCTIGACQVSVYAPGGPHPTPFGVAVDGLGDVFVADSSNGVFEIPANGSGQTLLYNPTSSQPTGVAVDGAGDLFISDSGLHQVVEYPAGCRSSCQKTIGLGWAEPASVAVDAAGDVIVADPGLDEVVEVPFGCSIQACQIILAFPAMPSLAGTFQAYDAVPDNQGNIFIADVANNRIDSIYPGLQAFNFAESSAGNQSGDSPRSVLFQNIGNQPLTAAGQGLVFLNPSFTQTSGPGTPGTPPDCNPAFSLVPGAACNLSVNFDPLSNGTVIGYADFYDNSLNNPTSLQAFEFTGTGVPGGTEYALTVTDTGLGNGTVTDNFTSISCSDSNGNVTGSCSGSYVSGTSVILTANPTAGSTFTGWGGACASYGTSAQCTVTMSAAENVSASFVPGDFGNVNVGSTGSLQVTFTPATTINNVSVQVVTQGAPGPDFTVHNTSCASTVLAGNSCTATINFTPTAPGLRMGAVELSGSSGLVATQLIFGIGQAPEVAFGPATTYTSPSNITYSNQVTAVPNLNYGSGMTTDAAGNLYQVSGSNLLKVVPGGSPTTVATGFSTPYAVAIDGAGNFYVADPSLNGLGEVVKLSPGCASTSSPCASVLYVPAALPGPIGVAVDGSGDVFISDSGVFEIPAGCSNSGCYISLYSPGGSSRSGGVALDAAGDLFVADSGLKQVVEIPAGCSSAGCQIHVGSGWVGPYSVAVDAASDVIVADPTLTIGGQIDAGGVVEVPVGCTTASCQILLWSGGAPDPSSVAVNAAGQIFIATDGTPVIEINQSQPVSLNFAATPVGSQSSDSPQTFTVQNIGNQPLSSEGPSGVTVAGPNFLGYTLVGPTPYCNASPSFVVQPGQSCDVGIDFDPQISGSPLTSTAVVTDNTLNGAAATQIINLSGAGVTVTNYTLAVSAAGTGSGSIGGTNCSTGSYPSGTPVTCTETPVGGSQFTGWSGGTCSGLGSCSFSLGSNSTVVANFSLSYTLTVTPAGTGSGTVTDNQGQIICTQTNGVLTGPCSGSYSIAVTLTASASGASTFVGWGGGCSSQGTSATCSVTNNLTQSVSASFVAPGATQPGTLKPITAGVVYGQGGSFTGNAANNGGVSANTLADPAGGILDSNGNLYVGDTGSNRVLFYPAGSTTATRVYGQGGSFTTVGNNQGGISANSLNNPYGLAVDSSGNLYVADLLNSRVLFYPAGSTTATRVYGQSGSFTDSAANNGGISANSLNQPYGVALDSSGNLYIADSSNNRVLFYPAGSTTATRVYGQGGSFTTSTANNGGVSANGLNNPLGLTLDSSGDLYVADELNNRVLFYPAGSTTATRVYGQGGSLTTNAANEGGISANSLNQPYGTSLDSSGNLYIGDTFNNRVLFYPFASTTATRVYGQLGSFTSNSSNPGGVSANTLVYPEAVPLDSSGNLYVADYGNNRVLEYGSFGNVNVCPSGLTTPAPCNNTVSLSYYAAATTSFGATQVVTQGATGLDFSLGSGSTCTGTVNLGNTCTVDVKFAPLAPGLRMGAVQLYDGSGILLTTAPVYGNGQGPEIAFGPSTQTTVNTGSYSLLSPAGAAVDAAGNLYISDNGNQRVVKVAANGTATTVGTGLNYPQGLAVDGAGDLFIADNNLNEVVEVPAGCTSSTCQKVVGGPQCVVGVSGLCAQLGVAVDGAGDVFISSFNGEVVKVPADGSAQTTVYNPAGSNPIGLAVDAAGDLFIADFGLAKVVEIPAGCTNTGCQIPVGTGWFRPEAVAVDAAGDVFVADEAPKVVEVPAGCVNNNNNCQITVSGILAYGVAVDGKGNVFLPDLNNNPVIDPFSNQVVEISQSLPPSLSFPLTNVSSPSAPQTVSIQNVGNQPLTGSLNLSLGANFTQNATQDCSSAFPLAPGATCGESFTFTPQSTGYLTGTANFSDNTLNLSPLVVLQTVNLSGNGGLNNMAVGAIVPNVVGLTQAVGTTAITAAGLAPGTVSTASNSVVPSGSVIASNPPAGTQVSIGSAVRLLVSTGQAQPATPNPLSLENNYFVTGDYATGGVSPQLRGTGHGGMATGTITIADSTTTPGASQAVPDGADIIDGYLYWETLENTATPSGGNGTFLGYPIIGQQMGSDLPYNDGTNSGTLRVYRADVNTYFPVYKDGSGVRSASGTFTVSLPDGGTTFPVNEGASLVVIYRVLSPNFPLKAVVIYDGSAIPTGSGAQNVLGFYDSTGTGESTTLSNASGTWNNSSSSVALPAHANQFSTPLTANNAYAAVILSTPVTNTDNDGILDAWKAGPAAGDFYAGQPGYYDVKTGSWVPLPGALHGEKDLFVQLDYMCGNVLSNGVCDPSQENLFPAPDAKGNDPLAMVTKAFAATGTGIHLHLEIGNAVPEDTCTDNTSTTPPQLCQFPSEPGVIGWKNSLEFSKLWPRNLASCAAGVDCSPRFPYGQKDSYHYVLFGHSLAIPAWNSRYGSLMSINVASGVTTILTADRGTGINACPSRITISGVLGNPSLNGVYNTTSCANSQTMTVATPDVTNWSYPNSALPEPEIGITSGTVTSISGYSDLGGADSSVTLGLWETAPNQDMSKRANVIAGTLFHEIGHTLGLSHGGLYYDGPSGSYIPTFDVNCKPNYQSSMNYLFQLDGVGPGAAVAFSNQTLAPLTASSLGGVMELSDTSIPPNAATFPTSSWYAPYVAGSTTASPATLHCDGTPITSGEPQAYRVDGPVVPAITPAWSNSQDITYDGALPTSPMLGYNDAANIDLRQLGATGGEFASLASVLSFGSSTTPLDIAAGGSVSLGAGGTVTVGRGGTVTLGGGGNVTVGSGSIITPGGGSVTLNNGGTATLSSGGTVTLTSSETLTLSSGGTVTLGGGGIIAMGGGGTVTLGGGGTVTLGGGGIIALGGGGSVTIPSTGGTYTLPDSGGMITLVGAGTVALGGGGLVTLGGGGTIAMGGGGTVALGGGGTIALGGGGTIALGGGGTVTLGGGGNVTLGGGGTVTLGGGGTVALGGGGTVTLGGGGTVTLGGGGNVTLGGGGTVTLGGGGTVTLGGGGTMTVASGGSVTLSSGGTITSGAGTVTIPSGGGSYTLPAGGGTITLGGGGTVTLGGGGTVTLGGGGVVALGGGGTIALGGGGTIALGGGGTVTLGGGGASTAELDYNAANSIVRPPSLPTETPISTPAETSVVVNWTAPAFGVVATYTISRSSDGGTPVVIGSVSGVNGNPPATTFTDTNPDLTSQTVVYTISTTLLPIPIVDPTPRQSLPSAPAVQTNSQTIVLGSLPSSVTLPGPQLISATAESNGAANGLQVNFSAAGACAIGSQSPPDSNGVSSASVTFSGQGSCTVTASQPGTDLSQPGNPPYFNAADPVSGTFTILPQGSNTQSQSIVFPQLPNVQYGGTFSLSASTLPSGQTVSFAASGPCMTNGKTTGVGLCTITASALAYSTNNTTYSAASVSQSFTIYPAVFKVTANNVSSTYGQTLPTLTYMTSSLVNGDLPGAVTGTPVLSTTATIGSNAGTYPITVGPGTLAATNYSFLFVSGTLTIGPASQAITFTTNAPASAPFNSSFTVAASAYSGSPATANGNAVTFTSSGSCTITGTTPGTATYKMNNSTGTCSVIASQAGNTNYSAATPVTQTVNASGPSVTVSPSNINFGTVAVGSITTKTVTVSNTGNAAVAVSTPLISLLHAENSNEFVVLNLCPSSLAAGKSCTITVSFVAGAYYSTPQTATLEIMDNAPGSPQPVALSASILTPQTIMFTTSPPASAAYKSSFPVAATGGGSGNAVTFTSSGACSITGTTPGAATYTMNSSTGTCSVIANQAGNSSYSAAPQVTKTVTATLAPQTIMFTTNPPASAAYKSSFPVAATGGGSGNAVTFTSSGACSITGTTPGTATYTMNSSSGTCSVIANQAGNSSYSAAPQVTKTVTATLAPQTIMFTTNPPASAAYKSSFPVAATGGGSGNAVTFTSSGACSNSGSTYTMNSSTGTCSVIANQAGNSNYTAATQVTKTVSATLASQTIMFTTNPPASAAYKSTFKVAATGGASGNAVTFTSSGACSNSGATYTMTSGTGTCSVIANQAGNSSYAAATPVTKTVAATPSSQTITFTTNPPASAANKSSFTVAASASSGLGVTFTSSGACSNSGAAYTMTSGTGTCSVIANQAGNSNYAAAAPVKKTVTATYSVASISPTTLSFGTVSSGKSSSPKTTTLSNTGTTPLIISSIGVTGGNASNFVQTNNCPSPSSSLAAGKSCTISVTFNSGGKSASASLTVTDNTSTGTQTVSLSGN